MSLKVTLENLIWKELRLTWETCLKFLTMFTHRELYLEIWSLKTFSTNTMLKKWSWLILDKLYSTSLNRKKVIKWIVDFSKPQSWYWNTPIITTQSTFGLQEWYLLPSFFKNTPLFWAKIFLSSLSRLLKFSVLTNFWNFTCSMAWKCLMSSAITSSKSKSSPILWLIWTNILRQQKQWIW